MEETKLYWAPLTPLTKEKIDAIGDGIAGVFRISYTNDAGKNFYVFFVGKVLDIKAELLSYLSDSKKSEAKDKNICVAHHIISYDCRFRFAEIKDEMTRDAAERQVRKFYQPSCNNTQLPNVIESIIINVT